MKAIIIIHGLIGSGKDTVASMIAENLWERGIICKRTMFAKIIKENVSNITGIPMTKIKAPGFSNDVYDFTHEQKDMYLPRWGMTLRKFLQIYGTEACRDNIHKDIWAMSCIDNIPENEGVYFVPDLRFDNEFDISKDEGALPIKVKSDRVKRSSGHSSENGLPDELFENRIVLNDEGLDELRALIDDFVVPNWVMPYLRERVEWIK